MFGGNVLPVFCVGNEAITELLWSMQALDLDIDHDYSNSSPKPTRRPPAHNPVNPLNVSNLIFPDGFLQTYLLIIHISYL